MQKPPLDPDVADVADVAPAGDALTAYNEEHIVTYWRVMDAHAEGAE